ncbi:MAG: hypothetical protein K5905_04615 [Roseibium sp.]|uniref:hypothetical protein n=1 Tax=Roseibium sp. TaxID=1936156 RepID=UPI0026080B0B|nr:hypothetical protein [Roseibium sp.]MCV0424730.1 hypothetical protein [Roseibium sp.]
MLFDRRQLVGLAAAGAASLVLPRSVALAGGDAATGFLDHFSAQGFETLEPLSLITDYGFNGGLRYDDTRPSYPDGPSACVQPACRVEDAELAGTPGVLALFNIMVVNVPDQDRSGEIVERLVTYAVENGGLDPERLVFVSTDLFEPYRSDSELLQKGQFVRRELNEAMATGDGSGFFAPVGHPNTPSFPTVSVHYPLNGGASGELSYPLPGYLEIGEIALADEKSAMPGPIGGGFGLERLALAAGKPAPDFAESRTAFLEIAKLEATQTDKPLPSGYETYAGM